MEKSNKIFKDDKISSLLEYITAYIPYATFGIAILLSVLIGTILWFHTYDLFSFVKNQKLKMVISVVISLCFEAAFTLPSLVTATIRAKAKETGNKDMEIWAWGILCFSVLGSLGFTFTFLYWTSGMTDTDYTQIIKHKSQFLTLMVFACVLRTVFAEITGFLIYSSK